MSMTLAVDAATAPDELITCTIKDESRADGNGV